MSQSISWKNEEGYPDPTPYFATHSQEHFDFHPIVYICSKYSDDTKGNTKLARQYCRSAVDMGYLPIAPHLYFPQFLSDEDERDLAMFLDYVLMTKCIEFWICGAVSRDEWSEGMQLEVKRAEKRRLTIRYFDAEMREIERY